MKKRVNYSVFQDGAHKLEIKRSKLCESIGYTASAYNDWEKDGSIPEVAGLAIECLLRRNQLQSKSLIIRGENVLLVDGIAKLKQLHDNIWLVEVS